MNDFLFCMLLFGIMIFFVACTSEEKESNKIEYKEIASGRYIQKVEFKDHTYIYMRNYYSAAGDKLLHDPSCKCLKKE